MKKDHYLPAIDLFRDFFTRQQDIVFAYLFGSVARKQATDLSDVDIAVFLKPEVEVKEEQRVERQLTLAKELENITGREIQVTLLNQAPPLLAYMVIRDGILLYQSDNARRVEFEVHTMKIYFDFQPRLDFYHEQRINKIREIGFGKREQDPERALNAARRVFERLKRTAGS